MIFSAVRKITLYPKAGIKLNDINKSMVAQYKKEMREKGKKMNEKWSIYYEGLTKKKKAAANKAGC